MHKIILVLTLTIVFLTSKITSLESKFTQTIETSDGKNTYSGKIYIDGKYMVWKYYKPFNKYIYTYKNRVIIVEPDLEQVTKSYIKDSIDFLKIINNLKKNSNTITVENIEYKVTKKKNTYIIEYKDKLDQEVSVILSDIRKNLIISKIILKPDIPSSYDIIK